MCTVTCIINKDEVLLTSNRDVPKERPHSLPPEIYNKNGIYFTMPLDPRGKGSWIGTNGVISICLLNHSGKYNSEKSRGELVMNLLSGEASIHELSEDSKHHNPFRLIYINRNIKNYIIYTWNGLDLEEETIKSKSNIWISKNIYKDNQIALKTDQFNQNDFNLDRTKLLDFHLDPINIREDEVAQTSSITQIYNAEKTDILYKDLVENNEHILNLNDKLEVLN